MPHLHQVIPKKTDYGTIETTVEAITAGYIPLIAFANFVVLFTIIKIEKLHTPQNVVLACVAVADMLYGIIIIPIDIFTNHMQNIYMCWFRMSSLRFFLNISLSFLTLMTIERFVAINFVFYYVKVTNRRIISVAMMLIILEICHEPIFVIHVLSHHDETICYFSLKFELVEIVYIDAWKMAIYLCISLMLSLQVAFVSWKQHKKLHAQLSSVSDIRKHTHRNSQVKITICRMFIFIIVWLFVLGSSVLLEFTHMFGLPINEVIPIYSLIIKHLLGANAFINPIVYALLKPTFKTAFMFLIRNKPCRWNELQEVIREEERSMNNDYYYDNYHRKRTLNQEKFESSVVEETSVNIDLVTSGSRSMLTVHDECSEIFPRAAKNSPVTPDSPTYFTPSKVISVEDKK